MKHPHPGDLVIETSGFITEGGTGASWFASRDDLPGGVSALPPGTRVTFQWITEAATRQAIPSCSRDPRRQQLQRELNMQGRKPGVTGVELNVMPTTRQGATLAKLDAADVSLTGADLGVRWAILHQMRDVGWITRTGRRAWSILPAGREVLARWQAEIALNPPDFALATLRMKFPPFAGGSAVTFDGSTDQVSVGACAAVAGSGHALVGWWTLPPINAVPLSTHAELQGLRLALRLSAARSVTEIRTDSRDIARQARAVKDGGAIAARTVGEDLAAVAEVTEQLLNQPVTLVWEGTSGRHGDPRIAAVSPGGLVAHKLAIMACRMVRDGFDPSAERGFLRYVALRDPSSRKQAIARVYDEWRTARQRAAQGNG